MKANSSQYLSETHEVFNQPTALENFNAYDADIALQYWLKLYRGDFAEARIRDYGHLVGHELQEAGFQANQYVPELHSHDRFGQRIDSVSFCPAYHQLMGTAIESGLHSLLCQEGQQQQGAHVVRAAMVYLHHQVDTGTGHPITTNFAALAVIQRTAAVAAEWMPKMINGHYDQRNIPYFEKQGLMVSLTVTEKQGGSDVLSNATEAYPITAEGEGEGYELVGHKWFCSAPMCDAFLVLAQVDNKGLSCFLMPRWRPNGTKNQMHIQRLKHKLGNRSNASAEVEFRGAFAWMIGGAGEGVTTIMQMVSLSRFDCMMGSSGLMRAATAEAIHYATGRKALGKDLHQQPLMQNVLADLAIESEAALAMSMRVAHALDNEQDEQQRLYARVATAIGKYWICKRVPNHTFEALECLGGSGYIEDNIIARLYRDAPVNAIWGGASNMQCLDVLRAIKKETAVIEVLLTEISKAQGLDADFDRFLIDLKDQFVDYANLEYRSRTVVEKLALGIQASLLLTKGDQAVAEGYVASRIRGNGSLNYGSLDSTVATEEIVCRARPKL